MIKSRPCGRGIDMAFKSAWPVALLSIWIGSAAADEFKPPPTKEGLWETRTTQVDQGKTVSDRSVQMCQSKALNESMQASSEEFRKKNECISTVTHPSSNTYVEEGRCAKGPNAGSVTRVVYTYQGDSASHTEMHLNVGKSATLMVMDARYVGSCPTGMKPGDLLMNGKIIPGGF
jgi:hypothetical protein